jgi:16S rRNA (uracil1498-N3)-methyltransferase
MTVDEPRKWEAFLGLGDLPATRFVLHTGPNLPSVATPGGGIAFAVGPEGGFAPEEVTRATDAGWQPASLGPRVLRVETAALVAAAGARGGA